MQEKTLTYTISEIDQAAQWLITEAGSARIWLFPAEMGAGKTTLIKAICQQLGAVGEFSSPTYTIVNEYNIGDKGTMYHLDLYRLKSLEEAIDIGIEEYLFSGSYCFIEWPDLILPLLNREEFITIGLTSISEMKEKSISLAGKKMGDESFETID